MPEGDTVWLAASRLRGALAGSVLTRGDLRVPQLAAAILAGREVLDVVPRGKHLLTRLGGDLTLHTHFRMDGSWHLYRPGQLWSAGPQWQVRAVLGTDHWLAVGYRLPVVELLPTDEEDRVVGHLGPDVLGPDWDAEEALRRLRAVPDREIGMALLDQRNLAGLGNLYRTEACFVRGVSPWTPVQDVADLGTLVARARAMIRVNRGRWEQSTTGSTRHGEEHWVFQRDGRPCRRCGTRVRTAEQGVAPHARVSWWCPSCQPGPAPAPGSTAEQAVRRPPPAGWRRPRG